MPRHALAATPRVLACGESASRATNADQVELSFLREPIDRREMNPVVPISEASIGTAGLICGGR